MITDYHKSIEKTLLTEHPEIAPFFNDIPKETAAHCFNATSHSPEQRGARLRADYAQTLLADREEVETNLARGKRNGADVAEDSDEIIEAWFQDHRALLKSKYREYIHSHSRCASSFIVGPSNFPGARMQNRNDAADKKYDAIEAARQYSIKRVTRELLPHGDGSVISTSDPSANNKLQAKIAKLEEQRELMKNINKIIRKYFKNKSPEITAEQREKCEAELHALTGSDISKIRALIKPNEHSGRVFGIEQWQLSNLGAEIRRLKGRITEVSNVAAVSINDRFDNGITVGISDDQKICINFGFKPDEEMRTVLKRSAFKWSRPRMAWVRKLTANAEGAYVHRIKPLLSTLQPIS